MREREEWTMREKGLDTRERGMDYERGWNM